MSISFTNGESNSSNAGKTYGCSYTYKNISCKVYTSGGSTPSVAKVDISNFTGKSVNDFRTWCSNNGLTPSVTEQYSDSVASGYIISQNPASGSVDKGSSVSVVVSKGSKPVETKTLLDIDDLNSFYLNGSKSFDDSKGKISNYLSGAGFTNYSFVESVGDPPFMISKITVNGNEHLKKGNYASNSTIVVYINKDSK